MAISTFTRPAKTDAIFTVTAQTGGVIDAGGVAITDAGDGYMVGDVLNLFTESASGTGAILTVGAIVGGAVTGPIASIGVTDGGSLYADAETLNDDTVLATLGSDYYGHDQYEAGGEINEYAGNAAGTSYKPAVDSETLGLGTLIGDPSVTPNTDIPGRFDDNIPTIKTVVKADQPQLQVQKKFIDGGAVTVFAEPTTVDRNGNVVGNVLRAEDIRDADRCAAAGFTWVATGNGGSDGSSYGYCDDQTDYTAAFAADLDEFTCKASGFHYEASESDPAARCIDSGTAANFSFANFVDTLTGDNYATSSSAQDYAKSICKQFGYYWDAANLACVVYADPATFDGDKAGCESNGHVYIAGSCYDGAAFGDGHYRTPTTTQDPTDEPL